MNDPDPIAARGGPPAARLTALVALFENLAPADVPRLREHYARDAHFRDPFNDVRGIDAIEAIFAHLFRQVDAPRFRVREILTGDAQAVLVWDFEMGLRRPLPRRRLTIPGTSHLRFGTDGKVGSHHDYWDAAGDLYGKLPVLGSLMRGLRRRGAGA